MKIAKKLSHKYTFNIYDKDDIYQQAIILGIEGLENYDVDKGKLEHFLSSHVKKRLINFKRDNYVQAAKVEKLSKEQADKKVEMMFSKLAVFEPIDISSVNCDEEESMWQNTDMVDIVTKKEIIELIDNNLPTDYREDYLRLLNGVTISKNKKHKIFCEIVRILGENGYNINNKNEWL